MSKTRLVKWTHNGYHGYTSLSVRVPVEAKPGDIIEVSSAVARRLNRAVCGHTECRCGEHVVGHSWPDGPWRLHLPKDGAIVREAYPHD